MDFLTAVLIAGLLFIAGVYTAASRRLTGALYATAIITALITYIDEPAKVFAERARIEKIEQTRIAKIKAEKERKRLAKIKAKAEALKRKVERDRIATEQARERARLAIEREIEKAKQKIATEKRIASQNAQAAEIAAKLPNSFGYYKTRIAANTNGVLIAKRECLVDTSSSQRRIRRSISVAKGEIYYRNTSFQRVGRVKYIFFDDLGGGCVRSLQRILDNKYFSDMSFGAWRNWGKAIRVLQPGQTPSQFTATPRNTGNTRPRIDQELEQVVKEGLGQIFRKGLVDIFNKN